MSDCRVQSPARTIRWGNDLNVLFVTPWYPTKNHTYQGVFVREYAKAVQELNRVVVLHVGVPDSSMKKRWAVQPETSEILTEGVPTYRALYRPATVRGLTRPRHWASWNRAVSDVVKTHGPFDIVHAHVCTTGSIALSIAKRLDIPLVMSEHWGAFQGRTLTASRVRQARRVFGRAGSVLPVSHSLQRAIESYGINASFRVVPNVVDVSTFSFDASSRTASATTKMVTVTAPMPHKGLSYLLRALGQVNWGARSWCLDIVGAGADTAGHREIVEGLGLTERVCFHGSLPKHGVAHLMKRADFFILPSLTETFSVATAEALATGLPALITRCGGPEDFVDERCGLIVEPSNVTAIADGICAMLERLPQYDRQAISSSAARRFGPHAIAELLDGVYSQAQATFGR